MLVGLKAPRNIDTGSWPPFSGTPVVGQGNHSQGCLGWKKHLHILIDLTRATKQMK